MQRERTQHRTQIGRTARVAAWPGALWLSRSLGLCDRHGWRMGRLW